MSSMPVEVSVCTGSAYKNRVGLTCAMLPQEVGREPVRELEDRISVLSYRQQGTLQLS